MTLSEVKAVFPLKSKCQHIILLTYGFGVGLPTGSHLEFWQIAVLADHNLESCFNEEGMQVAEVY